VNIIERVIRALLYLCAIALCYYLILWVLGALGIHIPQNVLSIIMVMFALIAVLVLVRLFWPLVAGQNWVGDPR
jgi:putative effector of murein hydrolase LrgA (UPF0299 family)